MKIIDIGNTWADYQCDKCGHTETIDMEDDLGGYKDCPVCETEKINNPTEFDDLVSAAKIGAKWMQEWINNNVCDCETVHICGQPERILELKQIIEAIIKAEKIAKENQWMRVADGLPDLESEILFSTGKIILKGILAEYPDNTVDGVYFQSETGRMYYIGEVIHWMPLPEPPKESK